MHDIAFRTGRELHVHTPHDIEVLLHHYTSPGLWAYGLTGAYLNSVEKWRDCNFITLVPVEECENRFAVTHAGKRFIERILSMSLD